MASGRTDIPLAFSEATIKDAVSAVLSRGHGGTSKLVVRRIFRLAAEAGKLLVGKEVV